MAKNLLAKLVIELCDLSEALVKGSFEAMFPSKPEKPKVTPILKRGKHNAKKKK